MGRKADWNVRPTEQNKHLFSHTVTPHMKHTLNLTPHFFHS